MEKVAQAVGPLRPSLRAYVFRRQTIIAFGIILLFLLTSGIVSHVSLLGRLLPLLDVAVYLVADMCISLPPS